MAIWGHLVVVCILLGLHTPVAKSRADRERGSALRVQRARHSSHHKHRYGSTNSTNEELSKCAATFERHNMCIVAAGCAGSRLGVGGWGEAHVFAACGGAVVQGAAAREELDGDDAERPCIGSGLDALQPRAAVSVAAAGPGRKFRRGVREAEVAGGGGGLADARSAAQVGERPRVGLWQPQDVARLDVAVRVAALVEDLQALCYGCECLHTAACQGRGSVKDLARVVETREWEVQGWQETKAGRWTSEWNVFHWGAVMGCHSGR